ncbi:MAG TPA: hypothetical protein VFM29_08890, partial [Vicinamibacteria bacterium]|nr:hypothetical protein [Vicinamibacteria bacterium]
MTTALARLGSAVRSLLGAPEALELTVTPEGPRGPIRVPSHADGRWEIRPAQGRPCLSPDESSHYLYFVLPDAFRAR